MPEAPHTLWDTIKSVAASFFGVQSSKNRDRDFKHGKAAHFIVVGIVATVVFILTIVLVVRLVLRMAAQ
jgi:divalent metal cation (Fe/Co/Zn/Cd) transporter